MPFLNQTHTDTPKMERIGQQNRSSRLPGFYHLSPTERLTAVAEFAGVSIAELDVLRNPEGLPEDVALCMSENVVGRFSLPLGFATNFRVNAIDYVVPMVIEEPSVVAAASSAAKLLRKADGLRAKATDSIMIGQIHFPDPPPEPRLKEILQEHEQELGAFLDANHPNLVAAGGGFRGARVRRLVDGDGSPLAVVHIHVDVADAMGANAVNSMAEEAAPLLTQWTGARVGLRILSNLPIHRRVEVEGRVQLSQEKTRGGLSVTEADRIVEASRFAEADPYRAVTANKGVMNGIDAVLLATGQDFRAVEAAAHAFAARDGRYTALVKWRVEDEYLVGRTDLPLALGTVGGITGVHPMVRATLRVLGIRSARVLAEVVAAVGVAQNLAATHALAGDGIQRGHMRLHARNLAMEVGATANEVAAVVAAMHARDRMDKGTALEALEELRKRSESGVADE